MTSLSAPANLPRTLPRDVAGCFVPGERVLVAVKPGVISIVLRRLGAFVALVLLTGLLTWLAMSAWLPLSGLSVLMLGITLIAILAFWGHLDWSMRDYVLTDRRIISSSGVIRRLTVESPIEVVQQVVVYRSFLERVFGLGTIGVSTPADAGSPSVVWSMAASPDLLVAQIRLEMARAERGEAGEAHPPPPRNNSA